MRRLIPVAVTILLAVAIAFGIAAVWPPFVTAVNPDPNHTHADFAVWVNDTKLDFSADRYMMTESKEAKLPPGDLRNYLHMHDGNGHVIHRHKPGLTLGNFFTTIGLSMTDTCLTLDDTQFASLNAAWVKDFARTKNLCDDGKFRWTFVVNGTPRPMDSGYVFADDDKILLSYGPSETAWQQEWTTMTDDACRYSRTCPWKGPAPTESCISDPTIPCKE